MVIEQHADGDDEYKGQIEVENHASHSSLTHGHIYIYRLPRTSTICLTHRTSTFCLTHGPKGQCPLNGTHCSLHCRVRVFAGRGAECLYQHLGSERTSTGWRDCIAVSAIRVIEDAPRHICGTHAVETSILRVSYEIQPLPTLMLCDVTGARARMERITLGHSFKRVDPLDDVQVVQGRRD